MKRLLFIIGCISTALAATAQDEWKEASKESQAYREYRLYECRPRYGLKKIEALMKSMEVKESDGDEGTEKIKQAEYSKLTLREKFTYHMIHGESFSQICDVEPPIQDEHKKIFAHLPDLFGESNWAERQIKFMETNRDSVMQLIRECVRTEKRLGVNLKQALIEINAREMIPFLVATYKTDKKDHDILTVLMKLMLIGKYKEFMESQSYKKLYAGHASYDAFLIFNVANEELIIKRATDYYNGLPK